MEFSTKKSRRCSLIVYSLFFRVIDMSKMNWLGMETEIKEVLSDVFLGEYEALRCIDEIVARYTGRGNSMSAMSDEEYDRLAKTHPKYFDWDGNSCLSKK